MSTRTRLTGYQEATGLPSFITAGMNIRHSYDLDFIKYWHPKKSREDKQAVKARRARKARKKSNNHKRKFN